MPARFIPSKHFTHGRGGHPVKLIVVHTMEAPESAGRALQVAQWFAGPTAPQSSVHFCVDNKTIIRCVDEQDTAWAVDDWGLNQQSISIEHAGFAAQTPPQWHDPYSQAMLKISAQLVAQLCRRHNVPKVKLSPAEIAAGKSGICGHADITAAKHIVGGHTDPGPNFPWADYMKLVQGS